MRATTTLALLLAFAGAALAQNPQRDITRDPTPPVLIPDGDGHQLIPPPDGMTFPDLLKVWEKATDVRFTYSETIFRGKSRIETTGVIPIGKGDLDYLFQGMLVRHGYALIPTGPKASNTYKVEQIESTRYLKSNAEFVSADDVDECARHPARVFVTSIQLQEVEVSNVRGVLQQLLTNRQAEFAQEVQSSNSIVITGFGPTVAAFVKLAKSIDKPLPAKIKKLQEERNKVRGK